MAKVRIASSTVTSAPSISAGIRRAMKRGSNGTSVPRHILAVAGAVAQFTHPGVWEQQPFEVARLHEDRVLRHIGERRPRGIQADKILVFRLVIVGDRLVDGERRGAAGLHREE